MNSEIRPSELIAERVRQNTVPGQRNDPYKVAHILQGGAMRVALTGGAAMAERELYGKTKPIDRFDGTSSGVPPWIYILAGSREAEGLSIPYDELSKGFIRLRNLITKGQIVDLSLMNDAFQSSAKRLEFDAILHHPTETHAYATCVNDGRLVDFQIGSQALKEEQGLHSQDGEYIYHCHTAEDIAKALAATTHIPFYGGRPIALTENLTCVDGGISSAGRVPLQRAINSGATHILVFWTDKQSEVSYPKSRKEQFAAWWLKRHYPEVGSKYWTGHETHKATIDLIESVKNSKSSLPLIEVIRVPDEEIIESRETRPELVYRATLAGRAAMLKAFEPYDLPLDTTVSLLGLEDVRKRKLG